MDNIKTKKVVLVMKTYKCNCDVGAETAYIVSLNFVLESDELNEI
jgi:hypothetical protein